MAARGRRAEIVHVQGADAPVGNVVTAHCCNAAMRMAAGEQGWAREWNQVLGAVAERYCLSKASTRRVIAPSRQVKADIERHYGVAPERIVVIPEGVDGEAFHPRNRVQHRERVRQQFCLQADDFVVVFVGRDYRLKGLPTLVEAARRTRAAITILAVGVERRTVPAEILGDGLATRVLCVGTTTDIAPYYAAADCFALPTRYDSFSLATLEAMASGLPVIVSRAAGASEQLSDGKEGFLMPNATDAESLAYKLITLRVNQRLRSFLGDQARETAERLSWDNVANQTVAVYHETVRESQRN